MRSRGIWSTMSTGTRRSLTLAWTVLFVLSLLMQAGVLANPPSALASHDNGLFELDGNADDSAATPGADWENGAVAEGAADDFFVGADVEAAAVDDTYFTTGGSKDENDIPSWAITPNSVPDKDELLDAYAAVFESGGETWVYFGADRFDNDGDAQIGFWFFQNEVGIANGDFTGTHADGDVLILSEYTNGGVVDLVCAYEWDGSGGGATLIPDAGDCDPPTNGSNLNLVAAGAACDVADGTFDICARTNAAVANAPWAFTNKDGENDFAVGQFFEGGINLSDMFNGQPPCFGTFLAETRSSQETDAQLKDFALGDLNTCVPPTITTQVNHSSYVVGSGTSVIDTAHLTGAKGPVTGTVDFFLCGPTGAAADCNATFPGAGIVDAGQDKAINGSGDATSNAMSPTAPGWYCFRAEYTPAADSPYLAASHTNATTECFQVLKASPAIVTSATQSVAAGNPISDSATLSGGFNPTGTITFRAYGPDNATCAGAAVFTSATFPVNGNGLYGPASFTPAVAGVYRWIASYSGDANNNAIAGLCNDAGETDTVTKVNPTIVTSAPQSVTIGTAINDSATLAGGVNPTGTITFNAYGPNDATCSGAAAYTTTATVNGNGTYGPVGFTPTAVGSYRWIASYDGDANNNAVSGACNDAGETDLVNKTNPTIATVLHGGGQNGTSISVPLGTAVHDSSSLSGATADAGGTVHYQVFSDSTCQTLVFDAGTKAVTNGAPADSNDFTINVAGTYYWQADYSGDAKNNSASSACNLEIVSVAANIPTITTSENETVTIGAAIHDAAQLSGGFNPTGTITFKVYGNDTCAGTALATFVVNVDGNGTYGPVEFTPAAPGVYHWIASYSGDANNAAVSGGCGDAGENDTVQKASPTIATVASANVNVGGAIWDVATVSGGNNPTGTVTFNLYGPDDATCATSIFTDTKPLVAGVATSASFVANVGGTYRWIASYSGDANNNAVSGACNDENESVFVNQPQLTILKDVSGNTGGTAINGLPIAKVGDTLTFTLNYDISSPPANNGVITDPIPAGLEYVAGSATTDAQFDVVNYNPATRTLTWNADVVSVDGTLSFKVLVLETAPDLAQPIVNVATIDSDETPPDSDDASVLVQEVLDITNPPTSTIDSPNQAPSNPGFGLMLILLALASFALSLGYVTPVPARARRRTEGRR